MKAYEYDLKTDTFYPVGFASTLKSYLKLAYYQYGILESQMDPSIVEQVRRYGKLYLYVDRSGAQERIVYHYRADLLKLEI